MPKHKITKNLSEIGKFFRNNDASSAMFNILRTINSLRLPENVLFGRKSRCNQLYSLLNVFFCLLIDPCFMIRNSYNYTGSPLSGFMGCKKDVFYDFLRDIRIDWRKLMYYVNAQLWTRINIRSDRKGRTTCLVIDDTDFPKIGKRLERVGRVHSHLALCGISVVIHSYDLTGSNVHDLHYLKDVHWEYHDCTILGDKGYLSSPGQSDLFETANIRLEVPYRLNQKNWQPTSWTHKKYRKRGETIFSQLNDQLMMIRNYAKRTKGLFAIMAAKVVALTMLQYLNYINHKPIGQVKYALF